MPEPTAIGNDIHDVINRAHELAEQRGYDRQADLDEQQARADAEAAADRARRWPSVCPARFVDAHIDQLDGPLTKLAGWDRRSNILLLGNVGAGKTHAAIAAARLAYDDGATLLFRSAARLLDELRPSSDDAAGAMDRAIGCGVLVIDDLAAERPTDWTAERLSIVVDERWKELRPTIATSNLTPDQLEQAVGARMWSRLYHDATRITVGGDDRRRQDAA